MEELKYQLNKVDKNMALQITIYKMAKKSFEVCILEIPEDKERNSYCHLTGTFNRIRNAYKEQHLVYLYLKENKFSNVTKKYIDISESVS